MVYKRIVVAKVEFFFLSVLSMYVGVFVFVEKHKKLIAKSMTCKEIARAQELAFILGSLRVAFPRLICRRLGLHN